jgi:hypothetical protein
MNDSPSPHGTMRRSPEGKDGRGSKPACAGLDGRSASRVSRLAGPCLGAARRGGPSPQRTVTP